MSSPNLWFRINAALAALSPEAPGVAAVAAQLHQEGGDDMNQLQARIKADLELVLERDEDGGLKVTEVTFDNRSSDNGMTLEVFEVTEDGEEVEVSDELVDEVLAAMPGKGNIDIERI